MERYVDSWSYAVRGTDIDSLMFDISVYRAPITNDQDKKLVARRRFIPWAQKVLSPGELVQMYNRVYTAVNQTSSTAEDQLKRLLEPFAGSTPEEKLRAYLDKNVRDDQAERERLLAAATNRSQADISQVQQQGDNHAGDGSSDTSEQQQQQMLLLQQQQQQQGRKPAKNFHIFTRPPNETFMNPIDRACEVLPPQPMTNLCASVNRLTQEQRERVDALELEKYANGGYVLLQQPQHQYQQGSTSATTLVQSPAETMSAGITGTGVSFLARQVPTAQSEQSMFFMLATGNAVQPATGSATGFAAPFQWIGKEDVVIQLVQMPNGQLIARPSLVDEHVVHVDDTHIITVVVNLSQQAGSYGTLAVVDAAGKHQLARRSVLVDPPEEDVPLSPTARRQDGTGAASSAAAAAAASGEEEGSEQRWRAVRANVVQRGVVMEMARRAQSPAAPDANGSMRSVRMLRQALGVHDANSAARNNSNGFAGGAFKSGAEVFARRPGRDLVNILDDGSALLRGGHGGQKKRASDGDLLFTPLPPPGTKRVHWFIHLDSVLDIEREAVFARCTWILPPAGVVLDTETDRRCGVREVMQFTTQTAFAGRYLSDNFMYTTKHMLNCPVELHCLMNDVTPGTPRLVIEVFSGGDSYGHQTLEGYAVVTCSPVPGMKRHRVDMWRPMMSGWETLKSIFVGGSTTLVDREAVALPYGQLAADALHLDATVRRQLAEQHLLAAQQQQQQQQNNSGNGDGALRAAAAAMSSVAPLKQLPEEVQRDIALASSVACVNRSGLLTTSEGSVDLQIMCFVQQM